MADSSTSSESSSSSTSSGELESPFALNEYMEAAIAAAARVQGYTLGDRSVRNQRIMDIMNARAMLKSEIAARQGKRPFVSHATMTNNF